MQLSRRYELFLDGKTTYDSILTLGLERRKPPSAIEIRRSLRQCGLPDLHIMRRNEPSQPWRYEVRLPGSGPDPQMRLVLELLRAVDLLSSDQDFAHEDSSLSDAWMIRSRASLGHEDPARDWHSQLRVLHAIGGDASDVYDETATRPHHARWVRAACASDIPVELGALFSTHHIIPDEGEVGSWLHTHGLLRCGVIELEMMRVPAEHEMVMSILLDTTANWMLDRGIPPAGEPFDIGSGFLLMWLPPAQVAKELPPDTRGRPQERDSIHSRPSGVLVAVDGAQPRSFSCPTVYAPIIERGELVVSYTDIVGERLSARAMEQLPRFEETFRRMHGHPDWEFAVQIAHNTKKACGLESVEHLWFDVHDLDPPEVVASLMSQPQGETPLRVGQAMTHRLERIVSWRIDGPVGTIDPSMSWLLEEYLETPSS